MLKSPKVKQVAFYIIFFWMGSTVLSAQYYTVKERIQHLQNFDKKRLHYGYFFGFNNFGYHIEYDKNYSSARFNNLPNIELEKNLGFNVGLIGDLRINRFFNLRLEPGLYYSQRNLIYPEATPGLVNEQDLLREVKSTYIHVPLLIKLNAERINNWKPYLTGGVSTSFNLSSNEKNTDDNATNIFRVNTQTFHYEVGVGIDFYLVYFKFSPSIRGIFSFQNELIQDSNPNSPWTSNIINLISRGVVINLTFE